MDEKPKMIYDKDIHMYLNRTYSKVLNDLSINYGQLMNELNFSIKQRYLDKVPYPHHIEVKYPAISDEWINRSFAYEKIFELLEKDTNPEIHYNYSFYFIDRNIFSLIFDWLLTTVDFRVKEVVPAIFRNIEETLSFLNKNCPNNNSFNAYLDLWSNILTHIVENDTSFLINQRQIGDYLNKNEYYYLLALLGGNKK